MPHQRFPKVEVLSLKSHEMKFILSETDTSMANALRRIMIGEVPTLAIDVVEFFENKTVLQDEYIAHRLGLIPLRYTTDGGQNTDPSHFFTDRRVCICTDGCPQCQVTFHLKVNFDAASQIRPKDERNLPITITSADMTSDNKNVSPANFISLEEEEESQDNGISLVKIGPGQSLHFKATAYLGISKEHAKWCPVAIATYRFWPIITFNQEALSTLSISDKKQLVDCCPDKILSLDERTGELYPTPGYEYTATFTEDLHYLQHSLKKNPADPDFLTVKQSKDRFIFIVESTGCMDAEEIVRSGLKVMKEKLYTLQSAIIENC